MPARIDSGSGRLAWEVSRANKGLYRVNGKVVRATAEKAAQIEALGNEVEVVEEPPGFKEVKGPIEDKSISKSSTKTDSYPIHRGGGWYELSNGESVRGREDAEKAEAAL